MGNVNVQIPRVELEEMGPSMNLALRRLRPAGADMEREAMTRPKPMKKKVRPPIPCTLLHTPCITGVPEV
jgi:hypothetical protein